MASAPASEPSAAPPQGIRFWMLAVSLAATLPMLGLLVAVTLWLQHQQGLQREASLQRHALRAADTVNLMLAAHFARLSTVAAGVAARERRLDVLHQVLQSVATTDASIVALSFVNADGQRVIDSRFDWGAGLPPSGAPAMDQRILRGGLRELSPLVKGTVSGRFVVGMGVPVRDGAERTVGVLRLVLHPEPIDRQLLRLATPAGWVVAVVDQQAMIVARNQEPERFRGQRATDSLVAQLKRPPGEVVRAESRDGRQVLAVVAPVGVTGWHVAVGAPEAEVDRAERETLALVVLGGLVVVAASLAATLWIGRHVARQVQHAAAGVSLQRGGIRELRHLGRRIEDAETALLDARHDGLTGLAGRAHFFQQAQAQLDAQATGRGYGLLYIDLDGFKALNDARGHDAGDAALRHVGGVLRSVLRPADLAARLGGDEFVVLLSGRSEAMTQACDQVAARVLAGISRFGEGLSCSIGVVQLRLGEPLAEAMNRADQAMLTAKRAGKGRIVSA